MKNTKLTSCTKIIPYPRQDSKVMLVIYNNRSKSHTLRIETVACVSPPAFSVTTRGASARHRS